MKKYKEIKEDLIDDYCESCNLYEDLEITEAEYKGKTVKLNDPIRTSENKNKSNWAKATLIVYVLRVFIYILIILMFFSFFTSYLRNTTFYMIAST